MFDLHKNDGLKKQGLALILLLSFLALSQVSSAAPLEEIPLKTSSRFTPSYQKNVTEEIILENGTKTVNQTWQNTYLFDIKTVSKQVIHGGNNSLAYNVTLNFTRTEFGDWIVENGKERSPLDLFPDDACFLNDSYWNRGTLSKEKIISAFSKQDKYREKDYGQDLPPKKAEFMIDSLKSPPVKVLEGKLLSIRGLDALNLDKREHALVHIQVRFQPKQWQGSGVRLKFGHASSEWVLKTTLTQASNTVYSVSFSPSGDKIAYGSRDDNVYVHNTTDWSLTTTLTQASDDVNSISFSPSGDLIAYGSKDDNVYIHNTSNWNNIQNLTQASDDVNSISFSPSGDLIAYGEDDYYDGKVYIHNTSNWNNIQNLTQSSSRVHSVSFSPSGDLIAYGSKDDNVYIHNTSNWNNIQNLTKSSYSVKSISFSPSGDLIAYGGIWSDVYIHNTTDWSLKTTLSQNSGYLYSVSFSPSGDLIAYGSYNAYIHNTTDWSLTTTLTQSDGNVLSISFSPSGDLIAYGSSDDNVYVSPVGIYAPSIDSLTTYDSDYTETTELKYEGKLITRYDVTDGDGTSDIDNVYYNLTDPSGDLRVTRGTPSEVSSIENGYTHEFNYSSLDEEGQWTIDVFVNDSDGHEDIVSKRFNITPQLKIDWKHPLSDTNHVKNTFQKYKFNLSCSNGDCGQVNVTLDPEEEWRLPKTLTQASDDVNSISFSPSGDLIAYGEDDYYDGKVYIHNTSNWNNIRNLTQASDDVNSISFSPSGDLIAYGSKDDNVYIHNTSNWNNIQNLTKSSDYVKSISFSPSGDLIAYGEDDYDGGKVYIHNTSNWNNTQNLTQSTHNVKSISFSPSGDLIAYGSRDENVYVHNTSDWNLTTTLSQAFQGLISISFSPSGDKIAYGSWDENVYVHNTTDWSLIQTLTQASNTVYSVSFSPSGDKIAYGSWDENVYVHNTTDWSLIQTLTQASDYVETVSFSPSGDLIAYGSWDDNVYIHNTYPAKGTVTNTQGATPFYHNGTYTDYQCGEMNNGDTCTATFWAKVTGDLGKEYTFYGITDSNLSYVNETQSSQINIKINDPQPPTPDPDSVFTTSTGTAGESVEHRLKWSDNIDLSGYKFAFDNYTGSFVNSSFQSFSSNPGWSNVTKSNVCPGGGTVRWKVYANDTYDNWNESQVYSYDQWVAAKTNQSVADRRLDIKSDSLQVTGNYWSLVENEKIKGEINISVLDQADSLVASKSCSGVKTCTKTFSLGQGADISQLGNYTINVTAKNQTAYYNPASSQDWAKIYNLTVHESFGNNTYYPFDNGTVYGNVTLEPDGTPLVDNNISIWLDGNKLEYNSSSDLLEKTGDQNASTDSSGDYNYTFPVPDIAGTHTLKVNTTSPEDVYGEASRKFNVTLGIDKVSTKFNSSKTNYLDVDRSDHRINISASLSNSSDSDIDQAWVNVTAPDSSVETYYLKNTSLRNQSGLWYKVINLTEEFGDPMGRYNVSYHANTSRGIGSNHPETSFYLQNASLTVGLDDYKVNLNETITIEGNATFLPSGVNITGRNVSVWVGNNLQGRAETNQSGDYELSFEAPSQAGVQNLKVNLTDENGIKGVNSTTFKTFNLTARILSFTTDAGGSSVFKDSDSTPNIDFFDNLTADIDNPGNLTNVELKYSIPDDWKFVSKDNWVGVLAPGEWDSNNPSMDVGENASLGPHKINISASSASGITSEDRVNITVWRKSEVEHVNLKDDDVIPRDEKYFVVKARTYDSVNNSNVGNVSTEFLVDGSRIDVRDSNSTGSVKFNWSIKDFSAGEHYVDVITEDEPWQYTNTTGSFDRVYVKILGILYKDGYSETEDPVYRENGLGPDSTTMTISIDDVNDNPVNNATVFYWVNGSSSSCKTGDGGVNGTCMMSYTPPKNTVPGIYTVEVNASKENFATLEFNESMEIRGRLSLQQNISKNIFIRGFEQGLDSEVTNELNNPAYGNVSWKLNGSVIATGKDATWLPSVTVDRGNYTLNASTDRKYFDDGYDSREIEIYGLASIRNLYPGDSTILPNTTINTSVEVFDMNTSSGVNNFPVKFMVDGSVVSRNQTNSNGHSNFSWSPSKELHNISVKIEDNSTLRYNVSDPFLQSTVEIDKETYLEDFEKSTEEVYWYDGRTPSTVTFKVNLSETGRTPEHAPANNTEVKFVINSTENVSCITYSEGYCEAEYNPENVPIGNLDLDIFTNRTGWADVNTTKTLKVKGVLFASIESLTPKILHRGNTIDLKVSASEGSGNSVSVPVNWSYRVEGIATGMSPSWDIPLTKDLGIGMLEIEAGGDIYEKDTDSLEKYIYGYSSVSFESPVFTSVSYEETPTIRCKVNKQSGLGIANYPVEFVQNGTKFAEELTDSIGEASAVWTVPDNIVGYQVGCRIDDNSSLYYNASITSSSKFFSVYDNVPPDVTGLSVSPQTIDPGESVTVRFNATDKTTIDEAWVIVEDPQGLTHPIDANSSGANHYEANFNTSGLPEGGYTVKAKVNDTSGNLAEKVSTFSVNPGGFINPSKDLISVDNITQDNGQFFEAKVNLTVEEKANNTNITASPTESGKIDLNTTKYQCGNLSAGSSCVVSFEIQVNPGTEPGSTYVTYTGEWIDNQSDRSSVDTFTELDVKRNPVLTVETSDWSRTTFHGQSYEHFFTVNSTGNYRVEDLSTSYLEGSAPNEWTYLNNSYKSKLNPLDTYNPELTVSVPAGTAPGTYTGELEFTSSNGGTVKRKVSFDVSKDASYIIPASITTSAVEGGSGTLVEIPVENDGNVNFELDTYITGNASGYISSGSIDTSKQSTSNLVIQYGNQSSFPASLTYFATVTFNSSNPDYSIPEKTTDLRIDVIDFSVGMKTSNQTVSLYPGNGTELEFNVTRGSQLLTENLSFNVFVGNTQAPINNITEKGGDYTINYTVPEVEDARNHDVTLEVVDDQVGVTLSKTIADKIWVPDTTSPQIISIEKENIEPNGNTTLNVTASDNNPGGVLYGIANVTLTLTTPLGNTTKRYLNVSHGMWATQLTNLTESGDYKASITAIDPANLTTNEIVYIRVSEIRNLNGNFTSASGKNESAQVTFLHPQSKERLKNYTVNGTYNLSIQEGTYGIELNYSDNKIKLNNAKITQNTSELIRMDELGSNAPSPPANARLMGLGIEEKLNPESAVLEFNYTEYRDNIPSDEKIENVKLARCKDYDYNNLKCNGNFEVISVSDKNISKIKGTIRVKVPGFSSYTLYFPGKEDQNEPTGGGGGTDLTEEQIKSIEIIPELHNLTSKVYNITMEAFNRSFLLQDKKVEVFLGPGESTTASVSVKNPFSKPTAFLINESESISKFVEAPQAFAIPPRKTQDLKVNITAPEGIVKKFYSGSLEFHNNATKENIPVFIHVGATTSRRKKIVLLYLRPEVKRISPGENFSVQTAIDASDFTAPKEVNLTLTVRAPGSNESLISPIHKVFNITGFTVEKLYVSIPSNFSFGNYVLHGKIEYDSSGEHHINTAITRFEVSTPILEQTYFGLTVGKMLEYLLYVLVAIFIVIASIRVYRKYLEKHRRYEANMFPDMLPKETEEGGTAFLGKIADYKMNAFLGLDQLMTHVMVSGATGGGKTVSAQIVVEEALEEGKNVIVLDPTAQWSGFLRDCQSDDMLKFYDEFGLNKEESRSYKGNIRAIDSPEQDIDIKYMLQNEDESGSIIVFSLHKLEQKDLEKFSNSMIQQVFDANLQEKEHLDTIIVFDEVHRLLEKFGGTGTGLDYLERGVREFRKWGVGLVLVSQVIGDFPQEVRSNIGTKIQMRTRNKDELEFYKTKYGIDMVRSIVKDQVGSGMLQNAEYNKGSPYFVEFRPLKHSPHRLKDEELDKYEEYNERIESLVERIDDLEEKGEDVFDYRSRISLARKNVRKGSFNLVDIYLNELQGDLEEEENGQD